MVVSYVTTRNLEFHPLVQFSTRNGTVMHKWRVLWTRTVGSGSARGAVIAAVQTLPLTSCVLPYLV
ncbi:hypothetical protein J6590_061226 [Homalodisca vitripennis]|nr:hypothetical protein J6590_061226 [Homalodisca vitripennis]